MSDGRPPGEALRLAQAWLRDTTNAQKAAGLVGDTVNSSGVLGFEVGQVDGAGGVEGFLRGAGRESGAQK